MLAVKAIPDLNSDHPSDFQALAENYQLPVIK
jgi:hypothetical protein